MPASRMPRITSRKLSAGRIDERVHEGQPQDLGVVLGQPAGQRAPHRQRHQGHRRRSGRPACQRRPRPAPTSRPSGWGSCPPRRCRDRAAAGARRCSPAAARASARGRMDWGLPVKPWRTSTPSRAPSWEKGSAPGMMGAVTRVHATAVPAGRTPDGRDADPDRRTGRERYGPPDEESPELRERATKARSAAPWPHTRSSVTSG